MDLIKRLGEGNTAHPLDQDTLVKQRPNHFFHKKWRPLCFLQYELFEWLQRSGGDSPVCFVQEHGQEFFGLFHTQRIESELAVIGLAAPRMPILRAIVRQQDHLRGGQALTQVIQKGLRTLVQPLQVLKNQHDRLGEAFTHQEPFDGVKGALLADVGVHLL